MAGKFLQQLLVRFRKGIVRLRVDIQYRPHRVLDKQRHGQFTTHLRPRGDITFILAHITKAKGLAMMRHPAGNAFVDPQGQRASVFWQSFGRFNLQQARGRIHQCKRSAGCPHQRHRLADNQLERLLRFQRGMNSARYFV